MLRRLNATGDAILAAGAGCVRPSSVKLVAEVVGDGDGIVDDLLRRAVRPHLAGLDEITAIRDGQNLAHLMVGDEDADALVAQAADDLLMSAIVCGSMPVNGSSSRISSGSQTRQRAISRRRFSPPDRRAALFLRRWRQAELLQHFVGLLDSVRRVLSLRPRLR